ncbi:MAG: peptidylprolyl isomerase [Melioribacteraceae bacterium]|nr:peptidylprolyl isomerase [Melioribacteraceae bacterium]
MRSLAPWFIITVGGLFVLFMVLSDSKVTEIIGQRANNVGSINEREISYSEFSKMVEQYKSYQTQQTGQDIPQAQMEGFRDQVWDVIVSQQLMNEKVAEFGLAVSDDEIKEQILGPNPPAHLKQSFIDSTGQFNRELYEQAIFDPRNKQILITEENRIREQLLSKKLRDYVNASITVSNDEVRRDYIDKNVKMSAEYVSVSANSIGDSAVTVADDDLKSYYNENKDSYKISPQRKIKYVLFKKEPSKIDTLSIKNNLDAIVKKLKTDSSSFKTYVEIYSDLPYVLDTTDVTRSAAPVFEQLVKAKEGDIIGPTLTFNGFTVHRLVKKLKSKDTYVKASHILIKSAGDDAKAKKEADAIYQELKNGADFAELAKSKSQDGSASRGGDLGWFGEGQMVDEFWQACKKGSVDRVQKPVKSQFGYHVILVTDKTNNKFVVETIANKVDVSATTVDKLNNAANDFEYLAKEGDFENEAKLLGYTVGESMAFGEEAKSVPGIGSNKALIKFAFENDLGDVGTVFNVTSGYLVPMVSDIVKEGFKDFEEVKGPIRSVVLREKKTEKAGEIMAEIKAKVGDSGDLNAAKSVFTNAKVSTVSSIAPNASIPGIGREFAFTNYALNGELNKVSAPIKGKNSYFLVKVNSRSEVNESDFDSKKDQIRTTLLNTKQNRYFQDWLIKLKDDAEISDNRYMFYR